VTQQFFGDGTLGKDSAPSWVSGLFIFTAVIIVRLIIFNITEKLESVEW
jgi:hypothetical protein